MLLSGYPQGIQMDSKLETGVLCNLREISASDVVSYPTGAGRVGRAEDPESAARVEFGSSDVCGGMGGVLNDRYRHDPDVLFAGR